MRDENVGMCYNCESSFGLLKRKHHCRICGQIFCYKCSDNVLPGKLLGQSGKSIRACDFCYNLLRDVSNQSELRNLFSQTKYVWCFRPACLSFGGYPSHLFLFWSASFAGLVARESRPTRLWLDRQTVRNCRRRIVMSSSRRRIISSST